MMICLIRHGETDWNRIGRIQGREDIPLNPAGMEQARLCGEALRGVPWSRIYSSPLKRALMTARIVGDITGIREIGIEDDLIERDYGAASGMTKAQRDALPPGEGFEDIEDWDTLSTRVYGCVMRLACSFKEESLLLVSHGAAINSLLAKLTDHAIGSGKTVLRNGSISLLSCEGGALSVARHNMPPDEARAYFS